MPLVAVVGRLRSLLLLPGQKGVEDAHHEGSIDLDLWPAHQSMVLDERGVLIGTEIVLFFSDLDVPESSGCTVERLRKTRHGDAASTWVEMRKAARLYGRR